ncbi:Broad-complex core protein isoforms 1/2/3/4/5 [Armadillidium vulgare]|nr:Broad-complex core protein isoforms 1/2/3/4/5 [Armadillidium vulgare]
MLTRYMLPNQKISLILSHTLHLHIFIMITHTIDIEVFQISFYSIFQEVHLWELYMVKFSSWNYVIRAMHLR